MKKSILFSLFALTAFVLMLSLSSAYTTSYQASYYNSFHSPAYDYPTYRDTVFTTTTYDRPTHHGPVLVTQTQRRTTQDKGYGYSRTDKIFSEDSFWAFNYYRSGPLKYKETTVETRRNYPGSYVYNAPSTYHSRNNFRGPTRHIGSYHWAGY